MTHQTSGVREEQDALAADSDGLTINVAEGIADIRFARPDKLNAFDLPGFKAIARAQSQIAARRDIRCVVLSGEGRAFSAGIDLDTLRMVPQLGNLEARTNGDANFFQVAAWGWRTLPQPVVAAVHGYAFGAGLQIMLGADVRICRPDAVLAIMEARWGLIPDVGGIALLRTLVRDDVARDLIYTGRRFDGREAEKLGLVTHLSTDPRAEAMTLARTIASSSPNAIRAAKRLLNASIDATGREILLAESEEQAQLLASPNHAEALAAAGEDRPPRYQDHDV